MKILGWLFIGFGILVCFTVILMPVGLWMMAIGALLLIASAITRRHKAQEQLAREELADRQYERHRQAAKEREATKRAGVANSALGR